MNIDINDLTKDQREALLSVLITYFPELGSDDDMNGSDAVDVLGWLYTKLGGIDR